jgi:hypothetical protein
MKKLNLIALASLLSSFSAHSQLPYSTADWPDTISLTNLSMDYTYTTPNTKVNLSGVFTFTTNITTSQGIQKRYSSPEGGTLVLAMAHTNSSTYAAGRQLSVSIWSGQTLPTPFGSSNPVSITMDSTNRDFRNLAFRSITIGPSSWQPKPFTNVPTTLAASNVVNGFTANGGFTGGLAAVNGMQESGSGGVFGQQAQELNVGLTFQNGEWTPQ